MNDGGDCWTPTPGHFFRPHSFFVLFIAQCTYFLEICFYDNTNLLFLSSTVIDSTHYLIVYIHISAFHSVIFCCQNVDFDDIGSIKLSLLCLLDGHSPPAKK